MSDSAQSAAADAPTRFLVELDNTWTLLRVYGTEHPAFRRSAEAAAAVDRPVRISVSPRGFSAGKTAITKDHLLPFANRLRAMGLVGLAADRGLTAAQVMSLVLVLNEADRSRGNADAVVEKIAAATGGRVKATPLRLGGLRLVEGTGDDTGAPPADANVWRDLFAGAFDSADLSLSTDLAAAFENALRGQSPAQWNAMVDAWMRQLAAVDPSGAAAPPRRDGAPLWVGSGPGLAARAAPGADSPAGAGSGPAAAGFSFSFAFGKGTGGNAGAGSPTGLGTGTGTGTGTSDNSSAGNTTSSAPALDAVASFLGALSPVLCQRLLKETITGRAVPDQVVIALAERLPAGIVLGALSSVDRTNHEPSMAALALLRKIAANVPGGTAAAAPDAAPATSAQLAEVASSLERLLGTKNEGDFVPEEYLQRRGELSRSPLAASGLAILQPSDQDTTRHAAGLAFQILADTASPAADLSPALAFVRNRVGDWIRAGEFGLAREALSLATALRAHEDPAVAKPAHALVSASVNSDDLLEGARHRTDRARAVEELAELLRSADGTTLATLLSSVKTPGSAGGGAGTGGDVMFETLRRVLPSLPEAAIHALFRTINATPPPALLVVLSGLKQAEAVKAVQAIVPHAAGATRRAVVHVIFRRDFRWPLPLTDLLLCDDEPEIRRLAVMKLVSDADLATAANVLAAASKAGKYEADVALGLAELLRRHRHHPDVRPAWRTWTWSKRWWMAMLFVNIGGTPRRAA